MKVNEGKMKYYTKYKVNATSILDVGAENIYNIYNILAFLVFFEKQFLSPE